MKFKLVIILFCCTIVACTFSEVKKPLQTIVSSDFSKKLAFTEQENKNWHFKDVYTDSIPGISLYKAYEFLKDKTGDPVIVSLIDSEFDVNLDVFKDHVWVNKDEIPNNTIDDDQNGYVDDYNGWNFIANTDGNYTKFYHFESTRILKRLNPLLKGKTDTLAVLGNNYNLYKKAEKDFLVKLNTFMNRQNHGAYLVDNYNKAYEVAHEFFPNKEYTAKKLDSLYLLLKDINPEKARLIYYVSDCIKYDLDEEWTKTFKYNADNILQKCLNIEYDERKNIGDNPNDMNDSLYGSPKLFHDIDLSLHASQVAEILVNRNKEKFLKIMPIVISAHGEEHDKDIALAIRYAVNNGAKIINMSLGKELSLNEKLISDAVKYAAAKDVLIVYASGNDAKNVEYDTNKYYPNDVDDLGKEIVDNFISVSASTKNINENLAASFSNYGKDHIDIFAPGDSIYVYSPDGERFYNGGTSLATPMVSKTAALIRSYYPNLNASEVKKIILESGASYNIMVNKLSTSQEKELVPFSSLSKSGKIVNAYNALLMAEEVSKKKNKKN